MNNFYTILIYVCELCTIQFLFYANAQPPPEENCPKSPKNLEKLDYIIYYNGATNASKYQFRQICPEYNKFGESLSSSFKIGAYVGFATETGKITCPFYPNNDCTVELQHACASMMVSDFKRFVCCHTAEEKKIEDCLTAQGVTLADVNNCVAGKNPDINPQKILLDNANNLRKIIPTVQEFPTPIFNGAYDYCTFIQSFYYWLKTICKMFANPKKPPCP